ncbi:LLM class oxidoreductase [Actinokineospora bangkokensis]|uniref:Luciferase-like domain-containing protein n=1 Tax=Actinokineospora bangkokensis TaxID=1193682 RepID=A0A1Q9LRL0_9PSEU|nr:LLM class flavin-dependent oxidoreductase [Actinokineospora bangkokensis]OLR94650.1 hypothetical protein BJP25_13080 [Actinokineospora bangkokensis]
MTDWTSLNLIVPPHTRHFGFGGALPTGAYLDRLAEHVRSAEEIGVRGAFIYDFPIAMDPWLAAYDVLSCSRSLEPVVAVRPHVESPEATARRAVDTAYRFHRPAHVNVVAGATKPAREGAGAEVDKVAARARLAEFAAQLRAEVDRRADPDGPRTLVVTPSSSTPGVVPADAVLMMARPRAVLAEDIARVREEQGVRRVFLLIGLVVRDDEEAAWEAARELYKPDRRQRVAGTLFVSQVVSSEHLASYAFAESGEVHDERLWFGAPARGIDAPKLVGSVAAVRSWLRSCQDIGVTDVIVDLVPDGSEFARFAPCLSG